MRIISQDGVLDFNYDLISLEVLGKEITAYEINGDNWIIAEYSTEEQAKKEVKRLHELYQKMIVQREKSGMVHYINLPKVFQFAADEV